MNNWLSPIYSLLFLALWRVSYEAANSVEPGERKKTCSAAGPPLLDVPPVPHKEWAEKAIQRYADSQNKKWRNWQEAMFEDE